MRQQLGATQAAALCDALSTTDPSVSVRLNPSKWTQVTNPVNREENQAGLDSPSKWTQLTNSAKGEENQSGLVSPSKLTQFSNLAKGEDNHSSSGLSSPISEEGQSACCISSPTREESPTCPDARPVPWCPDAYYLPVRPPFTFDPLLHAGAYYVQDASSMFLAQVLSVASGFLGGRPVVLDLCAAPGGKSTLLRSLLPADALLVCNEPLPKRAQVLAENMTKWGHPAVVVSQNYPADFAPLTGLFDMIVADVPCSGEGMFRKDEGAVSDWSLANVDLCRRRQRDILSTVWPALKPGGMLVYSTCTFNSLEDEENVQWIARELGADVLPVPFLPDWGIQQGNPGYHFFPHLTQGEGFYVALLRKHDGASEPLANQRSSRHLRPSRSQKTSKASGNLKGLKGLDAEVLSWLDGDFVFSANATACTAFPAPFAELLPLLRQALHILSEGVQLAELKGRDWQPAHSLALSTALRRGAFPEAALSYQQALAYLRREAIQVDAPRGPVLVTFCGLPLGFAKNLGSRANNLYPQEWRIRSGYTTPFCFLY